ncbi:MAG: PilZ domain-containing protein [Terriglobales bacterium]
MPIVLGKHFQEWAETLDLRQSKRYRLRASVTFSWEHSDGSTMRGEGYTRDISPSGVYVLTSDRLPSGAVVKLEVALPSLRGQGSGAYLRTQGNVVRSEEVGFAATANMGFRMQLPETRSSEQSFDNANGSGKHEAESKETRNEFRYLISRTYSA